MDRSTIACQRRNVRWRSKRCSASWRQQVSLVTEQAIAKIRQGRRLVFTNGVFDILHAGHVDYLERARELGDLLVVALNTDASVRRLAKGPGRPINSLEDRARVIGALRCVDAVVSFDEDTPVEVIGRLRPEIHVKGGDYDAETMPETPIVRSYGGTVVVLALLPGRSTTAVIERALRPPESED
ncbi:MAG: D-glycero-beta-D-manno-heptose 1-phosphate adenylyltransferase [Armatimonadetes bacterium]|nr:D-glycero-beta-D-manno-heptose 1-phosphate adenylyltransferase [Armatimonadota bacterium]